MSDLPAYLAPTFAERKAARLAAEKKPAADVKSVDADETPAVENKSVTPAKTTRKTAKKS